MAYEYTHEFIKECGDAIRRGDAEGAFNALQPNLRQVLYAPSMEIHNDIRYALYGCIPRNDGLSSNIYEESPPDFVTVALLTDSLRGHADLVGLVGLGDAPRHMFHGIFLCSDGLTRLAAADVVGYCDAAGLSAFHAVAKFGHPLHACGYAQPGPGGLPTPPIPMSDLFAVLNPRRSLDEALAGYSAEERAPMRELAVQAGDAALVASLDTVDATLRGEKGLRAYVDLLSPSSHPDISVVQRLVAADPDAALPVVDPTRPDAARIDIAIPAMTALLAQDSSPEMAAFVRKHALPKFVEAVKLGFNRNFGGHNPGLADLVDLVTQPALKGARLPVAIIRELNDEQRDRIDAAGVKYHTHAGIIR